MSRLGVQAGAIAPACTPSLQRTEKIFVVLSVDDN